MAKCNVLKTTNSQEGNRLVVARKLIVEVGAITRELLCGMKNFCIVVVVT